MRKIFHCEQCPVSFGNCDTYGIQLRVKQICPVWRRLHPLLVQALCTRATRDIFRNRTEPHAGLLCTHRQSCLSRKLMRKCVLLRQKRSVVLRRSSQSGVPCERRQAPRRAFSIRRLKHDLLWSIRAVLSKITLRKKAKSGDSNSGESGIDLHSFNYLLSVTYFVEITLRSPPSSNALESQPFPIFA